MLQDERKAAREHDLDDHQQHGRHPGDEQQQRKQDRELPEDVLDPRERLRQVDLQRVGATIVGDEARAGVDGDEEEEDFLLVEELAEHPRVRRQELGLRQVRRRRRSARRGPRTGPTTAAAGR